MTHSFSHGAVVVTSISGPNAVLASLAEGSQAAGARFIVIGDSKSPADFKLPGCEFYSLQKQRSLPFAFARLCHERSYTRKNIGYLEAIAAGAQFIVETDDDNFPREAFWLERDPQVTGDFISEERWLNAYRYFSDTSIYPRGFPLERCNDAVAEMPLRGSVRQAHCPIQQGLADRNPDVDAIYRMLFPLPLDFRQDGPLILGKKTWCPFNSQNTTTFPEAYPLLYLPTFCSFRMTDIWRSFVAQRIAWTCDWHISFHASTVYQERNEHDLLRDFADEVPGYLNNAKIARTLDALELASGTASIEANMTACYQALIGLSLVDAREIELLQAWFADLRGLSSANDKPTSP
jgi:hypothetical protein